jgi:N-acetylglucosaminyl-diphospho-decaprenol L-rhamnosyltransferase
MSSDVTVIVVTYNSAAVIGELLESLPAALHGLSWRLIVADNDSHDDTITVITDRLPQAQVIRMGRNAGYAAGINAAVTADPELSSALILNPDIRLTANSVGLMLECLHQPGIGIVVPRLVDGHGTLIHTLRREPNVRRALGDTLLGSRRRTDSAIWAEAVTDPHRYELQSTSDWAAGPAMLISRRCLDACGPWDESFFLYSEETDFCLRARNRGLRLTLAPKAEGVHLEGDSKVSPQLWALLIVNRIKLYRRTHTRPATAAFWAVAVLREASRSVLGKPASRYALRTLLSARRMRTASTL